MSESLYVLPELQSLKIPGLSIINLPQFFLRFSKYPPESLCLKLKSFVSPSLSKVLKEDEEGVVISRESVVGEKQKQAGYSLVLKPSEFYVAPENIEPFGKKQKQATRYSQVLKLRRYKVLTAPPRTDKRPFYCLDCRTWGYQPWQERPFLTQRKLEIDFRSLLIFSELYPVSGYTDQSQAGCYNFNDKFSFLGISKVQNSVCWAHVNTVDKNLISWGFHELELPPKQT